jgi:hypothetical protein
MVIDIEDWNSWKALETCPIEPGTFHGYNEIKSGREVGRKIVTDTNPMSLRKMREICRRRIVVADDRLNAEF